MTVAPPSTSTSLIAPASSLSSSAGRSTKSGNAAIRFASMVTNRATDRGPRPTARAKLRDLPSLAVDSPPVRCAALLFRPIDLWIGHADGSRVGLHFGTSRSIAAWIAKDATAEHDEGLVRGTEVAVP